MHDKNATPIEAIDFETLQEPDKQSHKTSSILTSKAVLWLAFVILLLSALIVILFLPSYVSKNTLSETVPQEEKLEPPILIEPIDETAISSIDDATSSLSPEEMAELKQEAEKLLLVIIEKQNLLESKSVTKWAKEEFNIALTLGKSGDDSFIKKDYQQAISEYKNAINILTDLENNIAPTLKSHIDKGEIALKQAEKDTALFHFELAKSIDADNTQAIRGLKRAQTIQELYALLNQAGKLEAANRFTDAKASYLKATELDPLSKEAKEALSRVTLRLTQNEFTRLINQGYTALKLRQFSDARIAFNAAQKLFPNSDEPKLGLVSISQTIRNEKLSALAAEAQYFENSQDWKNAIKSYQQILSLSPKLSSAQQGLERSQQRADFLNKLNNYTNDPLRLSSEQVTDEAELLIKKVAAIHNPGSRIELGVLELKKLLQLAKQPIPILLKSDNQTDVSIFKVGKFGKFEQQKLELKMGKYTIVGSRAGFRDVRKVFTLTAEMSDQTITIQCDEPI